MMQHISQVSLLSVATTSEQSLVCLYFSLSPVACYLSDINVRLTRLIKSYIFKVINNSLPFFFSFLVAPGGTRIDDNDKTKMTNHCVFFADEDHDAIRNYAQVSKGIADYCCPFICQEFIVEHLQTV